MFSLFGTVHTDSAAVLVDVGSGSVGIALLHYQPDDTTPTILWSHREYAGISDTIKQPTAKVIKTALFNAFLEFDAKGRKALPEHLSARDITCTQVLISAPWVFTISKTVTYSQEHSFTITDTLVTELKKAAQTDTENAIAKLYETLPESVDLQVIQSRPIMVVANGYQTEAWEGTTTRTLKIDYLTALTHKSIIEVIEEMHEKIVPTTALTMHAHITAMYETMRALHPEITETCLIDITTEGTEVAVIRNGVLQHVTSTPNGTFSLARAIAEKKKIPTEEAYGYLQHTYDDCIDDTACQAAIVAYEAALVETFAKTGDALAVPKTVYTHMNTKAMPLLQACIKRALRQTTGLSHAVHYATAEILGDKESVDTSLLIAAQFYILAKHKATSVVH